MKEYWINVYKDGSTGYRYRTKELAIDRAGYHLAYRIHVKLK